MLEPEVDRLLPLFCRTQSKARFKPQRLTDLISHFPSRSRFFWSKETW
jgi:hypothetical protein